LRIATGDLAGVTAMSRNYHLHLLFVNALEPPVVNDNVL
jgi:hypothetical protein